MIYLNEICMLRVPNSNHCMNLFNKLLFLVIVKVHVPFRETSLARSVLD